ncbi:unnamed protein product [Adineta ricciae]|uniref:Uncharacterized protein n=1 Tax=Adineta ricciae TaxID=249248 RepID=A0A815FPE6_ADIRI|nr:unnamed protein product [Adineta ricciae]CAF1330047.1 unnamed protein product [Adineta ricciae]
MCSSISVKNEVLDRYNELCYDLNMDNETKEEAMKNYVEVLKHYVLEGDEIHWLSISLYISCRENKFLLKNQNNPISLTRLLKSANNLSILKFFSKLHQWENMRNLPENLRKEINQIEKSFEISSIIFEKYLQIFFSIFHGNLEKFNCKNEKKKNLKLQKDEKYSLNDFYSIIWTIYSLSKTIYPSTFNNLMNSFHLLLASFEFIYQIMKKFQLNFFFKENLREKESLIEIFSEKYSCSFEIIETIYFEHLEKDLIEMKNLNLFEMRNFITKKYDEIILTNCIIDERIFLENQNFFSDFLNSLNENRNSKTHLNKTPLTANQHFLSFNSNEKQQNLTPISQANQLIDILFQISKNQTTKPSKNLLILIGQQRFLDDLIERISEWKRLFLENYQENHFISSNERNSCEKHFDFSLKLFYSALENILIIEKSRLESNQMTNQQIQQSFQKLIFNNEFLKSLLGLCLLLNFYAHGDHYHDFQWICHLYSLQGYSFLKMIQIYLKTNKEISKCRFFIKYLSSIEEMILSSLAFEEKSHLWNEIQSKGILTYEQIQQIQHKSSLITPTNLTNLFLHSPSSSNQVKRKLFDSTPIIRTQSDPLRENLIKESPYTMFYRKYYQLVFTRLDLLCSRLFGRNSNEIKKTIWNFYLFLFENYTKKLFCQRDLDQILLSTIYFIAQRENFNFTWISLLQAYKSIPNSNLKTIRSVFIKTIHSNEIINERNPNQLCLTPSKPAGTIHLFDDKFIGDIHSFYEEIFIKIGNFDEFFAKKHLIDLPVKIKVNENQNEKISINVGENLFVKYSSNFIKSNSSNSVHQQNPNDSSRQFYPNSSANILSSSIQAGVHNRVKTTTTRTEDGKFLTTISTVQDNLNQRNENQCNNEHKETSLLFGQSSTCSLKRNFQNFTNSNTDCLTSLTKKVLQIENDRQVNSTNN